MAVVQIHPDIVSKLNELRHDSAVHMEQEGSKAYVERCNNWLSQHVDTLSQLKDIYDKSSAEGVTNKDFELILTSSPETINAASIVAETEESSPERVRFTLKRKLDYTMDGSSHSSDGCDDLDEEITQPIDMGISMDEPSPKRRKLTESLESDGEEELIADEDVEDVINSPFTPVVPNSSTFPKSTNNPGKVQTTINFPAQIAINHKLDCPPSPDYTEGDGRPTVEDLFYNQSTIEMSHFVKVDKEINLRFDLYNPHLCHTAQASFINMASSLWNFINAINRITHLSMDVEKHSKNDVSIELDDERVGEVSEFILEHLSGVVSCYNDFASSLSGLKTVLEYDLNKNPRIFAFNYDMEEVTNHFRAELQTVRGLVFCRHLYLLLKAMIFYGKNLDAIIAKLPFHESSDGLEVGTSLPLDRLVSFNRACSSMLDRFCELRFRYTPLQMHNTILATVDSTMDIVSRSLTNFGSNIPKNQGTGFLSDKEIDQELLDHYFDNVMPSDSILYINSGNGVDLYKICSLLGCKGRAVCVGATPKQMDDLLVLKDCFEQKLKGDFVCQETINHDAYRSMLLRPGQAVRKQTQTAYCRYPQLTAINPEVDFSFVPSIGRSSGRKPKAGYDNLKDLITDPEISAIFVDNSNMSTEDETVLLTILELAGKTTRVVFSKDIHYTNNRLFVLKPLAANE